MPYKKRTAPFCLHFVMSMHGFGALVKKLLSHFVVLHQSDPQGSLRAAAPTVSISQYKTRSS